MNYSYLIFQTNHTILELTPTALRLNYNYLLWYHTVARLLITGIIPFGFLFFCNIRIYAEINRRQAQIKYHVQLLLQNNITEVSKRAKEIQLSFALFTVVICFVICNLLRILLNIDELVIFKMAQASEQNGCLGFPYWTLFAVSISKFLLALNSSGNFFIYCITSSEFRKTFVTLLKKGKYCKKSNSKTIGITNNAELGHSRNRNITEIIEIEVL